MKTLMPKQIVGTDRKWYVIDAEGQNLGKLATRIAVLLKGKDRVDFASHVDNGAHVIVLNAGKVAVTGNKEENKVYRTHTGYMGSLKEITLGKLRAKKPTEIVRHAVFGMLPKNRLRDGMMLRLKLETGNTHGYEAQKPKTISV